MELTLYTDMMYRDCPLPESERLIFGYTICNVSLRNVACKIECFTILFQQDTTESVGSYWVKRSTSHQRDVCSYPTYATTFTLSCLLTAYLLGPIQPCVLCAVWADETDYFVQHSVRLRLEDTKDYITISSTLNDKEFA